MSGAREGERIKRGGGEVKRLEAVALGGGEGRRRHMPVRRHSLHLGWVEDAGSI